MKKLLIGVAVALAAGLQLNAQNQNIDNMMKTENLTLVQEWDKTFPKSEKVDHSKVTFVNRYGITLAADLYKPKNASGKLPAIAVSGPFGAVKEQSSGLYAQELAENGFLTIAFDPSYTGESGGEPRYVASPDINTEDFSAAVDYLICRDDVDSEKVGILGICGWGGIALQAAINDPRIKATVASTMYDMTRVKTDISTARTAQSSEMPSGQPWQPSARRITEMAAISLAVESLTRFRRMHRSLSKIITTIIRLPEDTTSAHSTPMEAGM